MSSRQLRPYELFRNGEGIDQANHDWPQSWEDGFLFLSEQQVLDWTDEPSFDDWLAEPMDLVDREELAEIDQERLDLRSMLVIDGIYKGVNCVVNSVELGQLLQAHSDFVVEDVHLCLSGLFVAETGSDHTQDMLDALEKHSLQLFKVPRLLSVQFHLRQAGELLDVLNTVGQSLSLCQVADVALEDIPCSLDIHNCVLTLMSIVRSMFIQNLRNS